MEILHDLKMQFIDLLLVRWIFGDKLDIRIMRILNTLPLGVHSMFNYSIDNARFKCRFR